MPSALEDDAIVNLADWVEVTALFSADHNASREDLKKALQRDGEMADENAEQMAIDVFTEIEDRAKSCGVSSNGRRNYPFKLDTTGTLLSLASARMTDSILIYMFLLAITRGDMSSKYRKLGGVDPTKVFERLCADILRNFWGGPSEHCDSLIFGTARPQKSRGNLFQANISELCEKIKEGDGWKLGARSRGAGDGSVDLVVWRRFSDEREGSLIGFAQCKTGVNWEDHLTKLNPENFSDTFFRTPLALHLARIYMVPSRIAVAKWRSHTKDAGILMDRCRIIQYAHSIDATVKPDCRAWLSEAMSAQQANMRSLAKR